MGFLPLLIPASFQELCSARETTPCCSWCLAKSSLLGDKDLLVDCFPPASSEVAWEYVLSSKNNSAALQTQAVPPFPFHNKGKFLHLCLPKLTPTTLSMKYSWNVCKGQNHLNPPLQSFMLSSRPRPEGLNMVTVLLSTVMNYVCDKCNHLDGLEKYLCPAVAPVLSWGLCYSQDARWCRQKVFISLNWLLKFNYFKKSQTS